MKNSLFITLVLFVSLVVACSNEKDMPLAVEEAAIVETSSIHADNTLKIDNVSINLLDIGKIQQGIRSDLEISNGDFKGDIATVKTSLLRIEDTYYLRTIHSNGYASTTLLIKGVSKKARTVTSTSILGVTCTTKSCASTPDCLPQGDYCTKCTGDCTKTVSNSNS